MGNLLTKRQNAAEGLEIFTESVGIPQQTAHKM